MMRERMSRPSSSVPNQWGWDGASRRAGRLMAAGSCGAIQGANRAKTTNTMTSTKPIAASGLWRAFVATERRNERAAVDMFKSVEFYSLNSARHCVRGACRYGKLFEFIDTPSPLGSIGMITLARNSLQNPEHKRVRGQNLEN